MELALQVADLNQLRSLRAWLAEPHIETFVPHLRPVRYQVKGWQRTCEALLEAGVEPLIRRIYFGTELCPWRAPGADAVAEAAEILADGEMPASLVLGPVSEDRWEKTLIGVERFSRWAREPELVVNDWGAAAAFSKLGLEVELGRFLFRAKRMARFGGQMPSPAGNLVQDRALIARSQVEQLATDPFDADHARHFLQELGVKRYQVELLPQGMASKPEGLPRVLVAPWVYVTGGRHCPLANLRKLPGGRWACGQRCLTTEIVSQYTTPTWPIVELGHTVFALGVAVLPHFLGVDRVERVLLEPEIPI